MSTYIKGLLQKQLENKFSDVNDFVIASTKGIGGNDNNEMRGELLKKGIKLTVVKNSLMRKALEAMGHENAGELFTTGPCTVAYGGDSVVDVAKELVEWSKKLKVIELKGAYVDGITIDGEGAVELSKMPNRAELQAQVAGLALSPGRNLAGSIAGPGGRIAGCIKSLIEKLEEAA